MKRLTAALAILCTVTQFSLGNNLLRTFIDPDPTSADGFGGAVAIDGGYVLVGEFGDDTRGEDVGRAHLFDADTGTLLHSFDHPALTPQPFSQFGLSVAIDGEDLLIGSPGGFTGNAYLFDAITGNLLRTFSDPDVTGFDRFGASVAIDGNRVLIGDELDGTNGEQSGQAHLFNAATGALLQSFSSPSATPAFDQFGRAVALEGDNVLVGSPFDNTGGDQAGLAYVFDVTTGSLRQTLNDPSPAKNNRFGFRVAIDEGRALIGSFDTFPSGEAAADLPVTQAALFDATTGAVLQTFHDPSITTTNGFGASVAIQGNNVLVGEVFDDTDGSDVGRAYLYNATTGDLVRSFNDPTVTGSDFFGFPVAIDGVNVVVGAFADDTNGEDVGQAHLFRINSLDGDYNLDNVVNAADYTVWRDGLGAIFTPADYDVWRANFGATTSSVSTAIAPEPNSAVLLFVVSSVAWRRRSVQRRRRPLHQQL